MADFAATVLPSISGAVPVSIDADHEVTLLNLGPALDPPDTTPPVVGSFSPALGGTISPTQPITFEVTDDSGAFRRIIVHAVFADGIEEVVHNGLAFRGLYQTSSQRVLVTNGFRYTVLRTGGWPSSPATFNVFALDESGNEAS